MMRVNRPSLTLTRPFNHGWLSVAAAAMFMLCLGTRTAEAISFTPSSPVIKTTTYSTAINTPEEWLTYFGLTSVPDLLYKSDVTGTSLGADKGPFADSYQTTFSNPVDKPGDAVIQYLSGMPSIVGCGVCYLVVKGGNAGDPAQYLFSLANWSGQETITLSGFWPGNGNISNVSIYGSVPEPAAVYLLGTGLAAAVVIRRRNRHTA